MRVIEGLPFLFAVGEVTISPSVIIIIIVTDRELKPAPRPTPLSHLYVNHRSVGRLDAPSRPPQELICRPSVSAARWLRSESALPTHCGEVM